MCHCDLVLLVLLLMLLLLVQKRYGYVFGSIDEQKFNEFDTCRTEKYWSPFLFSLRTDFNLSGLNCWQKTCWRKIKLRNSKIMDCYEKEKTKKKKKYEFDSQTGHFTWDQMNLLISHLCNWLKYLEMANIHLHKSNKTIRFDLTVAHRNGHIKIFGIFRWDMEFFHSIWMIQISETPKLESFTSNCCFQDNGMSSTNRDRLKNNGSLSVERWSIWYAMCCICVCCCSSSNRMDTLKLNHFVAVANS